MPRGQCCWIKSVQFQCHIATLSQNFSLFRVSGHHPKTCMTTHTHGLCLARYRCVNTFPCGHRYTFRVSCVDYLAIMLLKTCFYANIPCDSHPRKTDPVSIEKGLWKRFYQERKGLQDMQHQLKSNQEQDPVLLQDIFNKASQNVQLPIFQNVECTMHRPRT